MKIFLDMDDVLADFAGAALSLWDVSKKDVAELHDPRTYHIYEALSAVLGYNVTPQDFWVRVDSVLGFWERLPETRFARDLVETVSVYDPQWSVVTSPSQDPYCYIGKALWFKKFLNHPHGAVYGERFFPIRQKYLLAGKDPTRVLIDDRETSVNLFTEYGGSAILYPTLFNRLRDFAEDPVGYVMKELHKIAHDL